MMAGIRLVTPSLLLADQPPQGLPHARAVDGPGDAMQVIQAGGVAVLPVDAVRAAVAVLEALGLTPEEIRERIEPTVGDPLFEEDAAG